MERHGNVTLNILRHFYANQNCRGHLILQNIKRKLLLEFTEAFIEMFPGVVL
jgi:hypothetical protein